MSQISEDERTWGLIAWIIPLVGGIIGIIMRPNSGYVKHWSYLSIAFGLVIIVVDVILDILTFALIFIPPVLLLMRILGILVGLAFLIIWLVGILRERSNLYWKPPVVYDIARIMGKQ